MRYDFLMSKALVLHCGKSTQGRLLSKHFACPFYDTDDIIQEMTGKSPRLIYSEQGESGFITTEKKACVALAKKIATRKRPAEPYSAVIATGGGICKNDKAIATLRKLGTLVFLNADEKIAADRIVREVKTDSDGVLTNLPAYIAKENPQTLEDVRSSFHRFYIERTKKYAEICSVQITMKPVSPEENMVSIIKAVQTK